ncbi:unnamed protein product [Nesidiocoris tenuis]|uniref:Uncharacterized protein n=1 Tax=Nesidiocoris tenuis TaxID=355587 RepID=A0A6H5HK20_9HEMI|nr:unnamed protein product [Nesidiocoris tenuis]
MQVFHCVHFECPAQQDGPPLRDDGASGSADDAVFPQNSQNSPNPASDPR